MRVYIAVLAVTALICFSIILLFYIYPIQPKQNMEASPNLTIDTQVIDWGSFNAGGSSTKTVMVMSTTNTELTVNLKNPNLEDLPNYLHITVSPTTLTANQPTILTLTLTADNNTPPLQFNVDVQLTASPS
jgi:hypothetical protein